MFENSVYLGHFFTKWNDASNSSYFLGSDFSSIEHTVLSIILDLFLTLVVIFTTSVIADEFLVPILEALAKLFRMPDNLAGVTLLAWGNGAPDIFTCKAGFIQGPEQAGLAVGALLGAALFDFLIVVGIVTLSAREPFRNASRPFLRDIVFYIIGSTTVIYLVVYVKQLDFTFSCIILSVYITYIGVVVVGRIIRARLILQSQHFDYTVNIGNGSFEENDSQESDGLSDENNPFSTLGNNSISTESSLSENIDNEDYITNNEQNNAQCSLFFLDMKQDFIQAFNDFLPFDLFDHENRFMFFFSIVKAIVVCPVRLFIHAPQLDENDEYVWHKLTISVQTFFGCVVLSYLILQNKLIKHHFPGNSECPLLAYILSGSIILSFLTYLSTKRKKAPKFYVVYFLLNFSICFLISSRIVDLLVDKLTEISTDLKITPTIMGMTLLAWGNCLGDIVSNGAMARNGKPRIGVSACFAGQLTNLLLGVTFAGFYAATSVDNVSITFTPNVVDISLWLAVVVVCFLHMFAAVFLDFTHSKFWCILMIVCYFLVIIPIVFVSIFVPEKTIDA